MPAANFLHGIMQIIEALIDRQDLTELQTQEALTALLEGTDAIQAQLSAFLVLLRAKGETTAEIAGLAKAMRQLCIPVDAGPDGGCLDLHIFPSISFPA